VINAIQEFKRVVVPERTRIESLFPLVLVFGGPTSDVNDKYSSCRNVFLSWAHDTHYDLVKFLRIPEDYPEWNDFEGYSNLVDFEKDAGCLTRGILLFSESHGALAELGAFCTDEILCERLLIVVANEYYETPSFVRLGPVKRIEVKHSEQSIYVASTTNDKHAFEAEVADVGDALRAKVETLPKTKQFNATETRDQFLLIADLIELFGALTETEIEILLGFMSIGAVNIKRMLNQLVLFELICKHREKTNLYYIPPKKQRTPFLKYSANAGAKFERASFKLNTILPELRNERNKHRLVAYEKIHGVSTWK
jgi:hypothetical protein